jgi:hypothetical protein
MSEAVVKLTFISGMKNKNGGREGEIVLHKPDEGQI